MKRFKITKVLSLALAAVFAVSVFTTNASAASRADQYRRELTTEEVQCLYSMFDAQFYASANADVMDYYGFDYYTTDCDMTLFAHFLACGLWEERQPNAQFNVDVYATRNVDLRAAYGDDIVAYYPISGQTTTHTAIRSERGLPASVPVVYGMSPLENARSLGAWMILFTGERSREMTARFEENLYLKAILEGVGNKDIPLHECKGTDHGSVLNPAFRIILKDMSGR